MSVLLLHKDEAATRHATQLPEIFLIVNLLIIIYTVRKYLLALQTYEAMCEDFV